MIYLSVCSRRENTPKELETLTDLVDGEGYIANDGDGYLVDSYVLLEAYDAESIYKGHQSNLASVKDLKDTDIIVFLHDDVEVISNSWALGEALEVCRKPGVGFVGVAGAVNLGRDAIWWNSRQTGEGRGFVFQGDENHNMTPNYFGPCGQVVALDGCLIAATYETVKKVGLDQPDYLTSKWDFYDLHMTLTAHLEGLNNFVVPAIIRHASPGTPRDGWQQSRQEFIKKHGKYLPCKLPLEKTLGLPK